MTTESEVGSSLRDVTSRLDTVLVSWGFCFTANEIAWSHAGFYASGTYHRGNTRIELSCRTTIDNVIYIHEFIEDNGCSQRIERFSMTHGMLMRALGYFADSRLTDVHRYPILVSARDGGDPVPALIDDFCTFLKPVLKSESEGWLKVIRTGWRGFIVEDSTSHADDAERR